MALPTSSVSWPPSGMASRALMARFSSTLSNWLGSTAAFHSPAAMTVSTSMVAPSARWINSSLPVNRRPRWTTDGCRGWRRANASSWDDSLAPRCTACSAESRWRAAVDVLPTCASISCKLPPMICRMLLKSCATPPVSLPTASSFCECCSAAWARLSSMLCVMSRVILAKPSRLPLSSDGVDDDVGEKLRAILAHAPALRLPAAVDGGLLQRPHRLVHGLVLGPVEARKMQADRLIGRVALDPFGAGIPVGDVTLRREHVDGVVDDTLHQQAEAVLAVAQRVVGAFLVADVAGDLGEADQLAVFLAQRVDHHRGPEAAAVLAHAPAFVLELAAVARAAQRALGQLQGAVLVGVKTRKMLADDFGVGIALEAARAGVPAGHFAVRRQHVDRIVGHLLDQQPCLPQQDGVVPEHVGADGGHGRAGSCAA